MQENIVDKRAERERMKATERHKAIGYTRTSAEILGGRADLQPLSPTSKGVKTRMSYFQKARNAMGAGKNFLLQKRKTLLGTGKTKAQIKKDHKEMFKEKGMIGVEDVERVKQEQ